MSQGGEERWELTVTLGPCEAFAEGMFTVLYAGSIGRYLIGELEAEGQCTGEFADSTFERSSGIVTVTRDYVVESPGRRPTRIRARGERLTGGPP